MSQSDCMNCVLRLVSHIFTIFLVWVPITGVIQAQDTSILLRALMFEDDRSLDLSSFNGWSFKAGHDPDYALPRLDTQDWIAVRPDTLTFAQVSSDGTLNGWLRLRFRPDSTAVSNIKALHINNWAPMSIYLDGKLILQYRTGDPKSRLYGNNNAFANKLNILDEPLLVNKEHVLAIHIEDQASNYLQGLWGDLDFPIIHDLKFVHTDEQDELAMRNYIQIILATCLVLLFLVYLFIWLLTARDSIIRTIMIIAGLLSVDYLYYAILVLDLIPISPFFHGVYTRMEYTILLSIPGLFPYLLNYILAKNTERWSLTPPISLIIFGLFFIFAPDLYDNTSLLFGLILYSVLLVLLFYFSIRYWRAINSKNIVVVLTVLIYTLCVFGHSLILNFFANQFSHLLFPLDLTAGIVLPLGLLHYVASRYSSTLSDLRDRVVEIGMLSEQNLQAEREKQRLIAEQNEMLELEVAERTREIEKQRDSVLEAHRELEAAVEELKTTQQQLVQQEKLASLGQLTAGIAHEIKNPLNFVNNFSSVSLELVDESIEEVERVVEPSKDRDFIVETLGDIKQNLSKILDHGTRADRIVKSMLQHSRGGSGKKTEVDFNAMVKEYVNLSFHGMRASATPITCEVHTDLADDVGTVKMIGEDFSRVLLNLCNNAFDAMRGKLEVDGGKLADGSTYRPKLTVTTRRSGSKVTMVVEDNGPGIPDEIQDKILQPFFTTKKGTEGTGLGLSISFDIVKAHGGNIQIVSVPGEFTLFVVTIPDK
jgi:signal transduction histidine kinase